MRKIGKLDLMPLVPLRPAEDGKSAIDTRPAKYSTCSSRRSATPQRRRVSAPGFGRLATVRPARIRQRSWQRQGRKPVAQLISAITTICSVFVLPNSAASSSLGQVKREAVLGGFEDRGILLQQPKVLGYYNWSVSDDKIWGDANLAACFSIDKHDLVEGIAIERFLTCVSAEDQPRIALAIHRAIAMGEPYSETYRVVHPDGSRRQVVAFGRCLRNEDGIPSFFSGVVISGEADDVAVIDDPLEAHCRAAIGLARQRNQQIAVRYLEAALFALGSQKRS